MNDLKNTLPKHKISLSAAGSTCLVGFFNAEKPFDISTRVTKMNENYEIYMIQSGFSKPVKISYLGL